MTADVSAQQFDPFGEEMAKDPHAFYRGMRERCPVFVSSASSDEWLVSDEAAQVFVVTTYRDLVHVLEHPDLFPSGNKTGPEDPPEVRRELAAGIPKAETLYESDPPAHTRLRALVQGAWSSARVKDSEADIRAAAHAVVDEVVAAGRADLFAEFADRFVNRAILDFIGLPREDHDRVKYWDGLWVKVFIPGHPVEDQAAAAREIVDYQRYLERHFEQRRAQPRDDLMTALVQARTEDGDGLSVAELVSGLQELYGAGYGNTAEAMANLLHLLLERRELWEQVVARPDLAEAAVEEGLRLEGPVQWLSREAARDTSLGGVPIPRGSTVMVSYVAANRDPADFPDPDRFDLSRRGVTVSGAKHVAHGRGIHYCVGAGWSRTALRIGLEVLAERVPSLRLEPGFEAEYHLPAPMIRCVTAVRAVWDV